MPGGGGSTGKVRTPVLPGFGKGRLLRLVGKRRALIQDPKGQRDTEYQEVFQSRQWQRLRLPLRAGSALPSHSSTPGNPRRGGEHWLQVPKTPPWRTRRPSQPDLREAVPNHRAGAAGSARESGGGQFSFPDFCPRMFRSLAGSGNPRSGGSGARVCVCWEGSPPRRSRSASASPFPSAHGLSSSPEAARASQSSLAFASRVSCRSPSPGPAPGAAAERLPAGERLRARTGAGGGGPVRGGRAGGRRAQRRWPPSPRLLAYSPPPALLSLPPLPSVIDPSRAPLLPPPGPFRAEPEPEPERGPAPLSGRRGESLARGGGPGQAMRAE